MVETNHISFCVATERLRLPPCTCTECDDHRPHPCGKEAIVKSPDGNNLFCADCLITKIRTKRWQPGHRLPPINKLVLARKHNMGFAHLSQVPAENLPNWDGNWAPLSLVW